MAAAARPVPVAVQPSTGSPASQEEQHERHNQKVEATLWGEFAGETVAHSAEASGREIASTLGCFASGGVLFVCVMMAIAQLKIDTGVVRIVTNIVLGSFALTFGISSRSDWAPARGFATSPRASTHARSSRSACHSKSSASRER